MVSLNIINTFSYKYLGHVYRNVHKNKQNTNCLYNMSTKPTTTNNKEKKTLN